MLAIRSNYALWLPQDQEVYQEPWQRFERTFSNSTTETRYLSEVIYNQRHRQQYWLLTTDSKTLPAPSTSFIMGAAPAVKLSEIGNCYGFRTWIEYGLQPAKDALGWADFRMTSYNQIEKWWGMMSASLGQGGWASFRHWLCDTLLKLRSV
jgi:SRSO17 transposase